MIARTSVVGERSRPRHVAAESGNTCLRVRQAKLFRSASFSITFNNVVLREVKREGMDHAVTKTCVIRVIKTWFIIRYIYAVAASKVFGKCKNGVLSLPRLVPGVFLFHTEI